MSTGPILWNQEAVGFPKCSLSLLFVSWGFASQNVFREFCDSAQKAVLSVRPFSELQTRGLIDLRFLFDSSLGSDGSFTSVKAGKVVDSINGLTHVTMESGIATGEEIWLAEANKGNRVIIVVQNSPNRSCTAVLQGENAQESALAPYVLATRWPFHSLSQPKFADSQHRTAALAELLSRDIGRICGLGYEEGGSDDTGREQEILFPNLTSNLELFGVSDAVLPLGNFESVAPPIVPKWLPLLTEGRSTVVKVEHPDPPSWTEYARIADEAKDNLLILTRPTGAISSRGDRYSDEASSLLSMEGPNLIEGGMGCDRGVYRPSPECIMRYGGFDLPVGASLQHIPVAFCGVCEDFLITALTGRSGFKLDGPRMIPNPNHDRHSLLASRFADALLTSIRSPEDTLNRDTYSGLLCTSASTRRVEQGFLSFSWPSFHPAYAVTDTSLHGEQRGGESKMALPRLHNPQGVSGMWAHQMWQVALFRMKQQYEYLGEKAIMGGPGVVAASHFGLLVNDPSESIDLTTDGGIISVACLKSLTSSDLPNLTPGSVMQLWPNKTVYALMLLYVRGELEPGELVRRVNADDDVKAVVAVSDSFKATVTDGKPGVGGHSVIYMGDNKIADQHGIDRSLLTNSLLSKLKFWIAAQWFDVEVPGETHSD